MQVVNTVHEENRPFFGSEQWYAEGFANVKLTEAVILCHAGVNTLRFYAVSPAIILERSCFGRTAPPCRNPTLARGRVTAADAAKAGIKPTTDKFEVLI